MEIHWRPRDLLSARSGTRRRARAAARLWMVGALVLGGAAACDAVAEPETAPRVTVASEAGSIGGRVTGLDGFPIGGATVRTSEGVAAVTDADGRFLIGGLAPAERLPVTVEAVGFSPTTKIYGVVSGETLTRPIRLQPLADPVVIPAGAGGAVPFGGNGEVLIPADAFEGVAPDEPVTVRATYIDSDDSAQFSTAPGDFTAQTFDGSSVLLESFGMLDVDARDSNGQQLELAPGQEATLRFPLRGGTTPTTRGLWDFDAQRGIWVEVGSVTVTPDSTQDATTTSVTRPKNVDIPIEWVCIRVQVLHADKVTPRPYQFVSAAGVDYRGLAEWWTGADGLVTFRVGASSTVRIWSGGVSQTVATPPAGADCPVVATLAF